MALFNEDDKKRVLGMSLDECATFLLKELKDETNHPDYKKECVGELEKLYGIQSFVMKHV